MDIKSSKFVYKSKEDEFSCLTKEALIEIFKGFSKDTFSGEIYFDKRSMICFENVDKAVLISTIENFKNYNPLKEDKNERKK